MRGWLNSFQRGSIFGAVIVGVAFAAALSTVPRYIDSQPTEKRHTESGESEEGQRRKISLWKWSTADPVAAYTLLLALIAAGQAGLFVWQLIYMRRSIDDTAKAAGAALRTAQSNEGAERARLFFRVTDPGLTVAVSTAQVQPHGKMFCGFRNAGKTPAILIEHLSQIVIMGRREGFPLIVGANTNTVGEPYAHRTNFPAGFIVSAGDAYEFSEVTVGMPSRFGDKWYAFAENSGDRSHMFLIGYIIYDDVFGNRYRRGYCAIFDIYGERFILMGDDRYNYEKKEENNATRLS
jgi:hypothetical protein